jgi:predicted acylesterase/phospholipase RssA
MFFPYTQLVLGGGGIQGILHLGALEELSKSQPLVFPDGVYGSSIGAILATYIAFELPLEKLISFIPDYLTFDRVVPTPTMSYFAKALSTKGFFPMDMFETTVIELFEKCGLDIRETKIGDAKMPLYIIASNISKACPTIFSKNVPLLSALKASCCIPGLFKPQEIYGNLYIDGDIFTPAIWAVTPNHERTLVLSLFKGSFTPLTPKNLDSISPFEYVRDIYTMMRFQFVTKQMNSAILVLQYPGLKSTSDISGFDIETILNSARNQLRTFLSKRTD